MSTTRYLNAEQQVHVIKSIIETVEEQVNYLNTLAAQPLEARSGVSFQNVKQKVEQVTGAIGSIKEVLSGKVTFQST